MPASIVTATVAALCLLALPVGRAEAKAKTAAAATAASRAPAVDAYFAQWTKPGSPGASIAVIQNGRVIYSRGYGSANLEYGIPNTPETVFHLASVSKQFTALAIYLLAKDGKLSLDDDVRKYVPELHDFGKVIAIRELLHHTSGVRDQWSLLALAGWRLDDEITDDDVAGLLFRQTELNFPPGDQFLYSNSGYTLLAMVVKRVSGKSLAEFAKERIFVPLGMTQTHFQEDYGGVVKDRAYSYERGPGGTYRYVALSYSTIGPSSLFSTVRDLALWDENFYTGKIGGLALLAQMQQKGRLDNGKEIPYASGLVIGEYRGLKTVEHSGGDAAYQTEILRFPDQHFSVVVLANAGDLNPTTLSYKIAGIYLKDRLKPAPASMTLDDKPEVTVDPNVLDAYVGDYEVRPGFIVSFTRDKDHLVVGPIGQPPTPMYAVSRTAFRLRVAPAEVVFDSPKEGAKVQSAILHQNGASVHLKRVVIAKPSEERLRVYEGYFYSPELGVIYDVFERDGALKLHYPRGDINLEPIGEDKFGAAFPIGSVKFACADNGDCNALSIDDGRVQNLRFARVAIAPAGTKSPN